MDEIEQGFTAITERIDRLKKDAASLTEEVKSNDAELLSRMAELAAPLVADIGLDMLNRGKQDGKGEIYNAEYYPGKMIILGKTDPIPFRPDNMEKRVSSQFCVLSEEGTFFELMYSTDNFIVDSYRNAVTPREVLDLYGYDVMYMLYRALHDFLKKEEELVQALQVTMKFVFGRPPDEES